MLSFILDQFLVYAFFRVPYFSVIREKETAIIVKPNGTVPPKLPCGNKKRVLGRKMNGSIFF